MLETQVRAVSTLPRPNTHRSLGSKSVAASAQAAPSPLPHVVPRRKPVQVGSRLARSETRMLTIAVMCTMLVCGLLIIYLGAYARITLLGIHQAQAHATLLQLRAENETLREQSAALQSPTRIQVKAQSLGMVRGSSQVCYIPEHA
jgi:cell division protein FtsL